MRHRRVPGRRAGNPASDSHGSYHDPAMPNDERIYTVPFNPPLKTGQGKAYDGGLSDEDVHRLATEAGMEGIHTSSWGENRKDAFVEHALGKYHGVHVPLIGHDYRSQVQAIDDVLEPLAEDVDEAEQRALDAADAHGDLLLELEGLRLSMAEEDIEPPSEGRAWGLLAKLGGLVLADLGLLTVMYQVLNLTDRLFLGIPFTSETALAASGAVLAIVLLAHMAGHEIRVGNHHVMAAAIGEQKEA